jgi:CRP-like cAMP-binding protein
MAIATSLEFGARIRKTSPNNDPDVSVLGRFALLSGAPTPVLAALGAASTIRHVPRRGVLLAEGSVASHVFLVLRGRVRAIRRSDSGREVTLETYRAGDLLADALLAPDRPLPNEWEAAEATDVLAVAREDLLAQVQAWPTLALNIAAQLLARLERSKQLAVGLALADVPERVAGALRTLAKFEGQDGPDGVVVAVRPTQQELANTIGACRETVSRIVSDLARRGLVTPRGRALVISRRLLEGAA